MSVQSVIFEKSHYGVAAAKRWLKKHNFKTLYNSDKPYDTTVNYYRFRQLPPSRFKIYRLYTVKPGIKFVIGDLER